MKQESKGSQLYLRLATMNDLDLLFEWANDPTTRENSFHTEQISYETHVQWFQKMMSNKDILQFILMLDNIPIGQARLSVSGNDAEIGYSVSENYRGMGYGKLLCKLLINLVKKDYPQIMTLKAQVKPQNVASAYCFQKCGFLKTFEQFELNLDETDCMDDVAQPL